MSQARVRAAVIGLGRHGLRHVQALQQIDQVELAAVCDMRAEALAEVARDHPQVKAYTDWKQLLETEDLDLVSVVTNGPSHAPITLAAAETGVRYILCEKPIATSVQDARAMIDTCRKNDVRLSISHGRRWVSSYQKLRELIADGVIGKLAHFWFTCGGGLFAANGGHILDLARMLSNSNATSVVGKLDQSGAPNPRGKEFQDPGAVALYWFENGMRLVVDMFEDLIVPPRIEIVGSHGRITINDLEGRWEILARPEEERAAAQSQFWLPLRPVPFEPVELNMVEMLTDALRELLSGDKISCTGEDGLASVEMLIGAHISSQRGSVPVQLPLTAEDQRIAVPFT
jgi:predicted dehydrogenase